MATKNRNENSTRSKSSTTSSLQGHLSTLKSLAVSNDMLDALAEYESILDECQTFVAKTAFESKSVSPKGSVESTVYCEALLGIAILLWKLNRTDRAIEYFTELLNLAPTDSLCARYWLAACWISQKKFDAVRDLQAKFVDSSAEALYLDALVEFATMGDCETARKKLKVANEKDRRFPNYLIGEGQIDTRREVRVEADPSMHSYARLFLPVWRTVPGSLTWASSTIPVRNAKGGNAKGGNAKKLLLPFPRQQLKSLPQTNATWQVCIVPMTPTQTGEESCWVVGVCDLSDSKLRNVSVIEVKVNSASVWPEILKAMQNPLDGQPSRPSKIELGRPELRQSFHQLLRELDCDCQIVYRMPKLQALLSEMDALVRSQLNRKAATDEPVGRLPLGSATWQIGFFHHPIFVSSPGGGVFRPWAIVALDQSSGIVLENHFVDWEMNPVQLWEASKRLMHRELVRPRRIEVSDGTVYEALKQMVKEEGIELALRDELREWHEFLSELVEGLSQPEKCSLIDGHQVNLEALHSFYQCTNDFYRQEPWRSVVGDTPIKVQLSNGVRKTAIVMGRSGMTLGLALYDQDQDMYATLNGLSSSEETKASVVIFSEEECVAPNDLYLIDRYGWPINNPDAYPVAMRLRPESNPTSISRNEMQILEAIMRCLPDFIRSSDQSRVCKPETTGWSSDIRLEWMVDRSSW